MTGFEVPISGAVLAITVKILVGTQFLKKMVDRLPFFAKIVGGEASGWISVGLSVVVAALAGFQQYAGDGSLTGDEAVEILAGLGAALGSFDLLKSWFGGAKPAPPAG